MLLINIKDIPSEGRVYDEEISAEELELDLALQGPVHFTASIFKHGDNVKIVGRVKARVIENCGRCLESFCLALEDDFVLFYQPRPENYSPDIYSADEDAGICYYQDNIIDLAQPLRDSVILAIPMKLLCREDCRGLCHQCGENLNLRQCQCDQTSSSSNPFKAFFQTRQLH